MACHIVKFFHLFFLFVWLGTLLNLKNKKHYFAIDLPAMILALGTGIGLLFLKDVNMKAGWFHMKMTWAVLLVATDIWTGIRLIRGKSRGTTPLVIVLLFLILFTVYVIKPNMC